MTPASGILPVDKPSGPTSHDIVARARRSLGIRRIGHTGTLDPFASGLLILCIGTATRLSEYLTALPKSYEATLRLGTTTTTDDPEGEVVRTGEGWRTVAESDVRSALGRQAGEILQVPPIYSAKRIAGERSYDLARRGAEVAVAAVSVRVGRIELTSFAPPDVHFQVDCSSGTYIRAIARDVGEELGVGGHLVMLRRTRVGAFDVAAAIGIDQLDDRGAARAALLPPTAAIEHLTRIELDDDEIAAVRNGRPVERDAVHSDRPLALTSRTGDLIAIAEQVDGRIQPRKVFQ